MPGRGEADLDRVEIVEHPAVLRKVLVERAERQILLAQLGVEHVSAMRLVDDDAIVEAGCWPVIVIGRVEDAPH